MAIWMLLMAMTALAVLAVLWPLSSHRAIEAAPDPNTQFYRDQIAEIERDLERGLLSAAEAEAAKAEAGRRLLRASAVTDPATSALGEPALRRRRAVSAIGLSLVPILALAIYGAYGSPSLPGQPLAARLKQAPAEMDLATAVAQIETHLQKDPSDGRGWEVIAPVYLRMGRLDDAVKAYEAALRLQGATAGRLTNYGEALVFAQQGIVSAEARSAFERALQLDGTDQKARFYLARAAEQDGQLDKARGAYATILAQSPADAPWATLVREQIARLDQPLDQRPMGARPTQEAIAGMVEGLAARLEAQGGTVEEWARLMRSYAVMGESDKAQAALVRARRALAGDQAGLQAIDAMAKELKLTATKP
jgi:cytochrome c-type biogenesis protein CcmH